MCPDVMLALDGVDPGELLASWRWLISSDFRPLFAPPLVERLRRAGKHRAKDECYCYGMVPMLGGSYEPSNFSAKNVVTHFQIWGTLLKEVWDLPDGARIVFNEVP
jgi:type VI secretion system (T6SS) immunity protein Tdi1